MPPTFGVDTNTVVGIIAGGRDAFIAAKEGAEDDPAQGQADLHEIGLTSNDAVIGLAASGRTPYVVGALKYARKLGCRTVSVACVSKSTIGAVAELPIEAITGPEVLTGSTRLKAGTAQKLILNMISTGSMTLSGKVYQNLMVDLKQSNEKLRSRGLRIIMTATGCSEQCASETLAAARGNVKTALTSILLNTSVPEAERALEISGGHVRNTLETEIV